MDRIKTSGGIVFKDGKFLFIYKREMWDLPPMNVLYTFWLSKTVTRLQATGGPSCRSGL